MPPDDRTENQLVLVAYYIRSVGEAAALVEDFKKQTGIPVARTIVVDNSGTLTSPHIDDRIKIVAGANGFWEFSGWITGMEHVRTHLPGLTILLNDSYHRNWTVKWPGRLVLAAMARDARQGRIAGWLDNFSRISRRVNSRIVILPSMLIPLLRQSVEAAIATCEYRLSSDLPLFDDTAVSRLNRWMQRQNGRWSVESATTRWPRIFVEHHLFDGIPRQQLSFRPRSWFSSQLYGIVRKLVGERR